MNEAQVFEALRERYPAPEWALLPQVATRTGTVRARYADAVAVGLWPSRGFAVHGFEIKVTRGDWLRELRNPEKAESFVNVCDSWWIAAGERGLVKPDELPLGWGLLEPHGSGLRASVTPKVKEAHPDVPRSQWIAIIRRAWESMPTTHALQAERDKGFSAGEAAQMQVQKWERERYEALKKAVSDFEAAAGIKIETWDHHAADTGRAFALFRNLSLDGLSARLAVLAQRAAALAESVSTIAWDDSDTRDRPL